MNVGKLRHSLPEKVYEELNQVIEKFGVNTPLRLAHFLGQCSHESGNFKFTVENLNYSAQALQSVFRKYFPDEATAAQFQRKPEKIANRVYGERMGNRGEESGDGWTYRGRGYIQLTGRSNYVEFNKFVEEDVVESPDLVSDKYPLMSAGWFWYENNINVLADKGITDTDITSVTRKVNGGTNGLEDRIKKTKQLYQELV